MDKLLEEIEDAYYWDCERRRRLRYHRNIIIRKAIREHRLFITFCAAITLGFFAFMLTWSGCIQPERERTAYAAGVAEAERNAAVVGGWDKWIGIEVAKVGKEVR